MMRSGVGIFQEYYQNTLLDNYSPSTISWIPSLQIFFMMAMVACLKLPNALDRA